jgi:hypothetical protein
VWGPCKGEARKATKASTSVNRPEVYCQSKIHGVHPTTVRQKFMVEHRQEQRAQRDLAVQVSGRDSNGTVFTQSVTASNISRSGALLSGLSRGIRSGDLLWVEYQQRKARFRIVWVRDSQSGLKTQAAVQRLEKEECPWPILGRSF